ncbi:MAG TPA: galactofuranose ABC transporter, permease protein YjfF, partial [Methylomirabilota bacterium]|nr:galactofuranose ABC transporter, permease protein YjfF [Methylomirabilota bacterium]
DGFFTLQYFVSFVSADAYLGIAALGLTFVILSGGIDLSVGAVIGCVSILIGVLIEKHHWSPLLVVPVALLFGTAMGASMGAVIHCFGLPPFLVTLAGMFFARGLGFLISLESVPVGGALANFNSDVYVPLSSRAFVPATTLLYLLAFLIAFAVAHFTRFGRNVYAIGGNEPSARLMGLPVGKTKIGVYTLSGFCAALAGVTYVLQNTKGDPTTGLGLELDAIAAVVIGGTLLSGGVGLVAGTLLGVMILGIIQAIITFQGTLNSWWTRIIVGALLLAFILLQKLIQAKKFQTAKTFQTAK